MEGVSFGITSIIEELGKVSPPPCELRMGGGGARSDVWLSVLAAVTGIPVARTNHVEASALGAAMCGAVAAGWSGNLHDAMSLVRVTWRFRATPERHAAYQDVYSFYNRLLMDLRPYFSAYAKQDIP
jgi:xylulokinase